MLTGPLLALLTASVCASSSDDASLLQQGVGAASSVSAAELKTVLGQISTNFAMLTKPRKMHTMAFDSLMKTVSTAEKLSPDTINVFDQILALLVDILSQMKGENTVDQAVLDAFVAKFEHCNSIQDSEDTTATEQYDTKLETLTSCKSQEASDYDDFISSCAALASYELGMNLQQSQCILPQGVDKPHIQSWTTYFSSNEVRLSGALAGWTPLVGPCNTDEEDLQAQRVLCGSAQTDFETHWCVWASQRKSKCEAQGECWTREQADYNGEKTQITSRANTRVSEARLITYLSCMITELKSERTDAAVCEQQRADAEASIQADYNVTLPSLASEESCDVSGITPTLDEEDAFVAAHYQDAWNLEKAPVMTVLPCV